MPLPKLAALWNSKNMIFAKGLVKAAGGFAKRTFSTPMGASYLKWMGVGAGLGAVRGLADNFTGNDRVSVLGGAFTGAMYGAMARGIGQGIGAYRRRPGGQSQFGFMRGRGAMGRRGSFKGSLIGNPLTAAVERRAMTRFPTSSSQMMFNFSGGRGRGPYNPRGLGRTGMRMGVAARNRRIMAASAGSWAGF